MKEMENVLSRYDTAVIGAPYDRMEECELLDALGDIQLTNKYQEELQEHGITDQRVTYSIWSDIPEDLPHDLIPFVCQIQHEYRTLVAFREKALKEYEEDWKEWQEKLEKEKKESANWL